jgi:hypothetical protein
MSVVNPHTGRKIKINGATYLRLQKGGETWAQLVPHKGVQRHQLKEQCGQKCFLQPEKEGFPVCAKCHGKCSCQVECSGVRAAKVRAHQYKHTQLYQPIDQLWDNCKKHE